MNHPKNSRRSFLKGTAGMVAAGGISSFVPKLNLIGEACAQSVTTGYKALVNIYLGGGGDSWNMLIPTSTAVGNEFDHTVYRTSRGLYYSTVNDAATFRSPDGLAIPRATTANCLPQAIALTQGIAAGGNLGLNPFMPEIASLYNQGRVAFLANVGTLVEPLTRASYNARRKPPQLYSHNDQTNLWQIGSSVATSTQRGFGGMIAGYTANPAQQGVNLPSAISISGSNRFLIGRTPGDQAVFPFQLSTSSGTPATQLSNYDSGSTNLGEPQRRQALEELLAVAYPQLYSQESANIFDRSLDLSLTINQTISQSLLNATLYVPANDPNTNIRGNAVGNAVTFPNTGIAQQLRQIARVIRISRPGFVPPGGNPSINANRQVFYASTGGYDTHSDQITSITAANGHHGLLQQLSQAINWFYAELTAIGNDSTGTAAVNEVIAFTMSDFGRTINGNDNGTDHAWGSVQFMVGGPQALNGGQVYGRYPSMFLDNRIGGTGAVVPNQGENFSRGQFIPTLANDQMSASLARWMGVDNANIPTLFPNIDNFATGPFANAGASPTFAYFNRVVPNLIPGVS
ncbi:MAG TPA: DUF1501 domain-containing protein [Xanthomonadales bacterium]|nr:DUF1501 domain-containing protein [Xanthomonadales bacterium]